MVAFNPFYAVRVAMETTFVGVFSRATDGV